MEITIIKDRTRERKVKKTLEMVMHTLVEDHGMDWVDAASLMQDASNAVVDDERNVHMAPLIREIEARIGKPLFED